jgi:hypothetical protein
MVAPLKLATIDLMGSLYRKKYAMQNKSLGEPAPAVSMHILLIINENLDLIVLT